MPTANPRVSVTLTPAVAAVLRELSELAGNSQSAIVGELLEMSVPVFERVITVLRAAKTVQESAKHQIATGLANAQDKMESQLGLLLGEMDDATRPLLEQAEAVARRGARGQGGGGRGAAARNGDPEPSPSASTPVPVTRGSGHPASPPTGPKGTRRGRV